jgi:hypothetical protein
MRFLLMLGKRTIDSKGGERSRSKPEIGLLPLLYFCCHMWSQRLTESHLMQYIEI